MSILSEIFGDCKKVKIVEAFIENPYEELSAPEIKRMADVSLATIHAHLRVLEEEGIIIKSRKIGKSYLYKLNLSNPKSKHLLLFENLIVRDRLKKEIMKIDKKFYAEASTKERKSLSKKEEMGKFFSVFSTKSKPFSYYRIGGVM